MVTTGTERGGGTGGSDACTGPNDGATLIMTNCANVHCHSPGGDEIPLPSGSAAGLCANGGTMAFGLPQRSKTQQGCIGHWAEGLVMAAAQ